MRDEGDAVGDLYLATVVINVQDMPRAVQFWSAALGYERRETTLDPNLIMLVTPVRVGCPCPFSSPTAHPGSPCACISTSTPENSPATSSA